MIINDNTEIASLLKKPQFSVDIVAGPCFAKACQESNNDIKKGEVYATFNYHGCIEDYPDGGGIYNVLVYTFKPRDEEPIFIPSIIVLNLNDLIRYVSSVLHDFRRFTTWAVDAEWGRNNNRYEAICRAFKSYWDMASIRTNLGVKLINTLYHQDSVLLYSWCDSHFDTPMNIRTIYLDAESTTLFAEMRPSYRGDFQ